MPFGRTVFGHGGGCGRARWRRYRLQCLSAGPSLVTRLEGDCLRPVRHVSNAFRQDRLWSPSPRAMSSSDEGCLQCLSAGPSLVTRLIRLRAMRTRIGLQCLSAGPSLVTKSFGWKMRSAGWCLQCLSAGPSLVTAFHFRSRQFRRGSPMPFGRTVFGHGSRLAGMKPWGCGLQCLSAGPSLVTCRH